ncbi:MAG: hypothetical protein KF850_42850 [Labilithrix sp.]|nr:hypothetical protein [Labilithrix sp.]
MKHRPLGAGVVASGVLLAACKESTSTTAPPAEPAQPSAQASAATGAAVVPCPPASPDAGAPRLASFVAVDVPGTYWIDLVFADSEWSLPGYIPMPHHHATRIELTNLAEHPVLTSVGGAHAARPLRFALELASHEVTKVPGRDAWRATYFARILEVCAP